MAYITLAMYNTDGVQRDFPVPFSFIKKEYVGAALMKPNDRGFFTNDPESIPFSWLNDHTIRLTTVPAKGYRLVIGRVTYADTPLVDFQDAAILIEEDLDLASLQALHVAQEARDSGFAYLESAIEYFKNAQAELEEKLTEVDEELRDDLTAAEKEIVRLDKEKADKTEIANKADRIHASQHAHNGFDPLTPESIMALRKPPNTGRSYLANHNGWVEYVDTVAGGSAASGVIQTHLFRADGKAREFVIRHPFNTTNVSVATYDMQTGERVYMREIINSAGMVTLGTTEPLPEGFYLRALLMAPGVGELGGNPRLEYVHEQTTPSAAWSITHPLKTKYPRVFLVNSNGNEMIATINWSTATETSLDINFAVPVSGKAILTV